MKTKYSQKPLPPPTNPMLKLYVGIGFIIIAVSALMLILLLPDKKSETLPDSTSYVFQKHGTAAFYDRDGNELCRFDIEIADTLEKQTVGLMYRDSLASNQAMLFPYDSEEERIFWMRNTYLPLDIIYISSDSTIVSINKNTTPFSEIGLQSNGPAQFVLEVNAGISDRYALLPGYKFSYQRD